MRSRSRRQLLHATGLAAAIGLATACSSEDTSDRYDSENSGYVSGNGVTTEIAPADRTEPVEFSGTTYDGDEFDSIERILGCGHSSHRGAEAATVCAAWGN